MEKASTFISSKKINFILHFSLRFCKDIVNWLFLVLWTCLAMRTESDIITLKTNIVFICRQKINFIPHAIMEIFQRYTNFWVLWACLVTLTQNDSITLQTTSMFIGIQRINFIIHFLQFDWLAARDPKFWRVCRWNINDRISFHIRLFPRKPNITKYFKKPQNPYLGAILGSFCSNLGKNKFSWKNGLCQFFNIRLTYHCAKN